MWKETPHIPGSHLASPGRYQETIAQLTNKYPNLKYRDYKLLADERQFASPSRVALLDLSDISNACFGAHLLHSAEELRESLDRVVATKGTDSTRRWLYIVEGLDPDYVSLFGSTLQVDPRLFMRHQRTAIWERHYRAGNTPDLPTAMKPRVSTHLEYPELRQFHPAEPGSLKFTAKCAENERHIALSRRNGAIDHIGVLHRKASFWSKETENGGWIGLWIVDEPLRRFLDGTAENPIITKIDSEPYQGGYTDFMPFDSLDQVLSTNGPPRTGMFDDLCYYFMNHAGDIDINADPRSAMIFVRKIVASHYMLLCQYHTSLLNHLAWLLSRRNSFAAFDVTWVEERWSDLLVAHRRCDEYRSRVQAILDGLGSEDGGQHMSKWTDTKRDFQHIDRELGKLQAKADSLISSFTGLAGIVGNRQSLLEARSVRVLTLLGMTFLPLSFTSGLFSMSAPYAPGNNEFWIFWAVSLPLVIVIFLFPYASKFWYGRMNHEIVGGLRHRSESQRANDKSTTLTWQKVKPAQGPGTEAYGS